MINNINMRYHNTLYLIYYYILCLNFIIILNKTYNITLSILFILYIYSNNQLLINKILYTIQLYS